MDSILEICNWLVKHPRILQLANQMYSASSSPLSRADSFNESICSDNSIKSSTDNKVFIKNFNFNYTI